MSPTRIPQPLALFLVLIAGLFTHIAPGQELHWVKRGGGSESDGGTRIAVDGAGNSYVFGLFAGTATFGAGEANQTILTSAGDADTFLAKYDSGGRLVWAKRAGIGDTGPSIAVDGAGNIHLVGLFTGTATFGAGENNQTTVTSAGDVDIFVVKYDSAGRLVWARRAGGTETEGSSGIAVDEKGNSYVTGFFGNSELGGSRTATFGAGEANQTVLTSAGNADLFVAKYDSTGALVWAKRAGGTGFDGSFGIALDLDGNSYVTGPLFSPTTFGPGEANQTILTRIGIYSDLFVAKYDGAGAMVWAKRAAADAEGHYIGVDERGNSYLTGLFGAPATFGPGESNQTILTSAGIADIFLAKYDSVGTLVWARRAGGTDLDLVSGMVADGAGNAYVTGSFRGTATFGAGEARQTILTSAGNNDIFVAKYDSSGALLWAKGAGGTDPDEGGGIAPDREGNSHVTGFLGGDATFGNQTILTSAGQSDMFVAKYGAVNQTGPITSTTRRRP